MTAVASAMLVLVPMIAGPAMPTMDRADRLATIRPRPGHIGLRGAVRMPPMVLIDAGPAAYYSSSYDGAGWQHIYDLQVSWGHYGGLPATDNRWCVHPDVSQVGVRLKLVSGGVEVWCTTGDFVRERDKASWRSKWGIEVSWSLWNELPDPGYVEVYRDD